MSRYEFPSSRERSLFLEHAAHAGPPSPRSATRSIFIEVVLIGTATLIAILKIVATR